MKITQKILLLFLLVTTSSNCNTMIGLQIELIDTYDNIGLLTKKIIEYDTNFHKNIHSDQNEAIRNEIVNNFNTLQHDHKNWMKRVMIQNELKSLSPQEFITLSDSNNAFIEYISLIHEYIIEMNESHIKIIEHQNFINSVTTTTLSLAITSTIMYLIRA